MTMVKADTYQSGRDADIMRERGQVWNYSEAKKEPQLANYNTDGRYLSEATNFELYNFVREYKTSDEIRRIWNPKKDESVIHLPDQTHFPIFVFLKESVSGFEEKRTAFSVHSS